MGILLTFALSKKKILMTRFSCLQNVSAASTSDNSAHRLTIQNTQWPTSKRQWLTQTRSNQTNHTTTDKSLSRTIYVHDVNYTTDKSLSRTISVHDINTTDKSLSRTISVHDVNYTTDKSLSRTISVHDVNTTDKSLSRTVFFMVLTQLTGDGGTGSIGRASDPRSEDPRFKPRQEHKKKKEFF